MKKVELIIEGNLSDIEEQHLLHIAKIKYKLPAIDSLVVEVAEDDIHEIKKICGTKNLFKNTHITMQMNSARVSVNAHIAKKYGYTGEDIGIAILDTGIYPVDDFILPRNRIVAFKDFINDKKMPYDDNGHGTHVAGIASGNGINSNGMYEGIAPRSSLIGVKVLNASGQGNVSDVLAGIQWAIDNKEKYNIRILNLSIGTDGTSTNDPLVKAVEKAWDLGIVVTIAAGNNGPRKGSISSPAISKKVITIGSSDDTKKATVWGNTLVNFSGRGPTLECIIKPDVLAPGVDIISCGINNMTKNENTYVSLSGTSMSTPIVSGGIALLLQKSPYLKPDDVKLMLKYCCKKLGFPKNQQGWGLIDINKLLSEEVYYAR